MVLKNQSEHHSEMGILVKFAPIITCLVHVNDTMNHWLVFFFSLVFFDTNHNNTNHWLIILIIIWLVHSICGLWSLLGLKKKPSRRWASKTMASPSSQWTSLVGGVMANGLRGRMVSKVDHMLTIFVYIIRYT